MIQSAATHRRKSISPHTQIIRILTRRLGLFFCRLDPPIQTFVKPTMLRTQSVSPDAGLNSSANLSSAIAAVYSNGGSYVAVKDSRLADPPAGCAVWTYATGGFALIFAGTAATPNGRCKAGFRCLCASCQTIFRGNVTSSAPGKDTHMRTHAHTRTCTHTRAHTCTHVHTHTHR